MKQTAWLTTRIIMAFAYLSFLGWVCDEVRVPVRKTPAERQVEALQAALDECRRK